MFNDNITIYWNIMMTENYDMFKKIGGNRKLNKTNYAKIVKSMKEEQLIIPIVVNERYEIIDGQHRFQACEDLGKPVYFYMVRGYGLEQVKRANIASSNWKKENYLDMFVAENNETYKEFEEIKERYDLNISNLLKIFAIVQEKQLARVGYEFENGTVIPGLVTFIDMFGEWVATLMENSNPLLSSIIVDGLIGGVGLILLSFII